MSVAFCCAFWAMLEGHAIAQGQEIRIPGGVIRGGVTLRIDGIPAKTSPPDPADAILLAPEEFRRLDVSSRQRIMRARLTVELIADPRILPLLEAGVRDRDRVVRGYAVRALQRVKTTGSPTLPHHPSLVPTLIELLRDPDSDFRVGIARALRLHADQSVAGLEKILLDTLATSSDSHLRAELIGALGPFARNGSPIAQRAVMSGLGDGESLHVFAMATLAMGPVLLPEALPRLISALSADTPDIRKVAAGFLHRHAVAARPYRSTIEHQFAREHDEAVRSALRRLLDAIDSGKADTFAGSRRGE